MREHMIAARQAKGLSQEQMAQKCRCSIALIRGLEEEDLVTHPNIVKRVARAYGLDKAQRTELLPENYRPGPNYDPDKYRIMETPLEIFRAFRITPRDWRSHRYE